MKDKLNLRLNLGAGNDIMPESIIDADGKLRNTGWINQDKFIFPGIDFIFDINEFPYPFKDNELDEVRAMRILEMSKDLDAVMTELHRICKNGAKITINVPAFPSPNSFMNPHIKSGFTYNTFNFYNEDGGIDNASFKAHFKVIKRKYIFSEGKLRFLNWLPNIFPKFYTRFCFMMFPSDRLFFQLEVIK